MALGKRLSFQAILIKRVCPQAKKDFSNTDTTDLSDSNMKSNWSTKTASADWSSKTNTNKKGNPSSKGDAFDPISRRGKTNRDGRRIPEDSRVNSKENWPYPGQTDETGYSFGTSKTSGGPNPSSKTNKGNGWSLNDEQQKSDWPSDNRKDEEWSSEDQQRKTDVTTDSKRDKGWSNKDQQGMTDWTSDSKKDNAWSSDDQQGRTDWPSNSKKDQAWSSNDQQGKSDWTTDNKRDQSWSSKDQQGQADAWSDSKKDQSWSSGDQQGNADTWSNSKKDQSWSAEDQQGKADTWSDTKSRLPEDEKRRNQPPGNQKGRTWSPGDQQEKSNWPPTSKMNKDWSSRDQQRKSDWSTNNKKDGNQQPINMKGFPTQKKEEPFPPLSKDKGTVRDTFQKDISESALNENDDWSVKENVKRPVWSSDDDTNAFNAKRNDDDFSSESQNEETGWHDTSGNLNNNESRNRRPNSHAQTDKGYDNNTPDRSNDGRWDPDSSVDNSNIWTSGSNNRNTPDQQSKSSKGDSSFPRNGNDRRTTNSKGGWDSGFKTSMENIPSGSNSAWTKDRPFDPSLSKGQSNDDSLRNSKTPKTVDQNKGLPRNPTAVPPNWPDSKDGPRFIGSKPPNRQSDWSNDDEKSTATYMSNRRDEMNLSGWWDDDEEFGLNSDGPKQPAPSWSNAMDDDEWSPDIKSDWSSQSNENKMPTINKGDWSSNSRENRMSKKNDEDWAPDKRKDWSSESTPRRMAKANDDWSSNPNSDWPTQSPRSPSSKVNRGTASGWDQRSDRRQGVKGSSSDGARKTKGSTKTGTPASKDWNNPPETKPGKPWKDEENVPKTINNMKGDAGMKEEKIVWSLQISSNGELGNGWVPVTLRPDLKKPTNRTQVNDKGTSKRNGDWSGVKQKMDGWDSEDMTRNTARPQFKMDFVTENVPPSSQMPDASIGHPFYIPLVNRRSKRANRLVSLTKKYIKPKSARRIYKFTNSGNQKGSIKTDDNHQFYLASADILVGDDVKEENQSNNSPKGNIRNFYESQKRYNETIKNSIPSLNRIKHLRNNLTKRNSTVNNVRQMTELKNKNKVQNNVSTSNDLDSPNSTLRDIEIAKDNPEMEKSSFESVNLNVSEKERMWDSLMEESETKELWSSPFDSSNIPESGWIPLFKVNKTSKNIVPTIISDKQKNLTEVNITEHQVENAKDLEQTETVVIVDSTNESHDNKYDSVSNDDTFYNSTEDDQEFEFEPHLTHNFTIDVDSDETVINSEKEMKGGNKILRIIPFSDIMKQLRQNESSNFEIEPTTLPSFSNKDEWNIPITSTPKMYNLKLVNDSEMQSRSIGSSWAFHKGKPKGSESWVLVKGDDMPSRSIQTQNSTSTDDPHKQDTSFQKNSTLYRLIVGNRTREVELSELNHKTEEARSKTKNIDPARTGFSFDLKNWHKDSGWTPLIRAIGSVTTRKSDNGKIHSVR